MTYTPSVFSVPCFSLCSPQLFSWLGDCNKHNMVTFGVMSLMAMQGMANIQKQREMGGDFRSLAQEEMLQWINTNTPTGACV